MNVSSQDTVRNHLSKRRSSAALADERQRQKEKTLEWISDNALETLRDTWKKQSSH